MKHPILDWGLAGLLIAWPWAHVFWAQERYWRVRRQMLTLASEADKLRIELGLDPRHLKELNK